MPAGFSMALNQDGESRLELLVGNESVQLVPSKITYVELQRSDFELAHCGDNKPIGPAIVFLTARERAALISLLRRQAAKDETLDRIRERLDAHFARPKCPSCDELLIVERVDSGKRFQYRCRACGYRSPYAATMDEATKLNDALRRAKDASR